MCRLSLCLLLAVAGCCYSFYLPGLAPTNFCTEMAKQLDPKANCKTKVFVHVNKLDSVETIVPYEYSSFDFCQPNENDVNDRDPVENLGQVVFGERLRASAYDIDFKKNQTYTEVCRREYAKNKESMLQFLRDRIHEDYMQQWVVDNMPVTWCYSIMESDKPFCSTRFPVGCYVTEKGQRHDACFLSDQLKEPGATYIFNHVHIILYYQKGSKTGGSTDGRIVRAHVQLASCDAAKCAKPLKIPNKIAKGEKFMIPYSYSVDFLEMKDVRWASRWDYILSSTTQSNVQWFSLINSVLITIFLSAMVGMILVRSLHRDIMRYNQAESSEDIQEDFGWKLVHGDVFRPPSCIMLLSVCVGSGAQIIFMTFIALVFACLGFLSPPNRGALLTAVLVLYVFMGAVAGYISARLYKTMGGLRWKSNVLMTAFLVPGLVFVVFFILNLFLWGAGSSAAIPFTTLLALLCLWFGISLPLTFFGAFLGFRRPAAEQPVRTNQIPREIPQQNWLSHPVPSALMGGILPFGCVFIQLFFILNSIWSGQMYYMFGFILLAFIVLLVVCAQTAVLLCYFHLCAEDYRWWWRSFFSTGTTALYLFFFSIHYFVYKTSITGALSYLLFFGYTFIMVFLFFIMTGTIGFVSSLIFVRRIYGIVKID